MFFFHGGKKLSHHFIFVIFTAITTIKENLKSISSCEDMPHVWSSQHINDKHYQTIKRLTNLQSESSPVRIREMPRDVDAGAGLQRCSLRSCNQNLDMVLTERQLFSTRVKKCDLCFGTNIRTLAWIQVYKRPGFESIFQKWRNFLAILTLKALLLLSLKYLQKSSEDT